jgi:hypothetical protein
MGLVATVAAAFEIAILAQWPQIGGAGGAGGATPIDVAWIYTWRTAEAQAVSGRPTKLAHFYPHCDDGFRLTVSATASHGTLTTKDGVGDVCGKKAPVTELWYQSAPGFHGLDNVEVAAPFYVEFKVTVR